MNQNYKYCPYCGYRLGYKISTDKSSKKECKIDNLMCNRPIKLNKLKL